MRGRYVNQILVSAVDILIKANMRGRYVNQILVFSSWYTNQSQYER